jgi:hypothetical protein
LWAGDEAFDLPCVLSLESVEAFLGAGLGWLYHYNYERVHSGYGMAGRTPYGCCVALGFSGSEYVGLMPVVLLDNIVLEWSRHGVPAVNDVLTHYITKATLSSAWWARPPRPWRLRGCRVHSESSRLPITNKQEKLRTATATVGMKVPRQLQAIARGGRRES